jgi:hypothetical protein
LREIERTGKGQPDRQGPAIAVRKQRYYFPGTVALLLAGLSLMLVPGVSAQAIVTQDWAPAVNLYDAPTASEAPAIAVDSSGTMHVFWGESSSERNNVPNTLFYSRWDGRDWSLPYDILISPEGLTAKAGLPSALAGQDGRINLAWLGGFSGTVYFSSARADEAFGARAWRKPAPVSPRSVVADEPRLAQEPGGRLHLVYSVPLGTEQGIYHSSSDDGGETWEAPLRVPGSRQGEGKILLDPRVAVSPSGAIHVAWAWANIPEVIPPLGVMYSRSEDNGKSWSKQLGVAEGPYRYPDLAVRGESEIHLVWSGTLPDRHKFHVWSQDGGLNWSGRTVILEAGGFHGYAGMAVDGGDTLHLAIIGGHPEFGDVLYHLQWLGDRWSPAQVVLRPTETVDQNLRNAAIAIVGGNEAHMVVEYPRVADAAGETLQMDLIQTSALLDAPAVAPRPLPTVTLPAPTPTAAMEAAAGSATTAPVATAPPIQLAQSFEVPDGRESSPSDVLVWALAPLIAALAVLTMVQVRARKR